MFVMLSSYFKGDDLDKALLAGAKNAHKNKRGIARRQIDFLSDMWVNSGKSDEDVFKLLQLDQSDDPFEHPHFNKWITFLKARYGEKVKYEKAVGVLVKHFKGEDFALSEYLVARMRNRRFRGIARKLLTIQVNKWGEVKTIEPEWVFKFLKIYNTENKAFDKLLFRTWVDYVKLVTPNEQSATKTMYSTLRDVCKDDLDRVLGIIKDSTKNIKHVSDNLQNARNQKLSEAQKQLNVELGESSSQKRQNVAVDELPAGLDVEPSRLKHQKVGSNKSPAVIDLNELPAESDVEPSRLKRQKSFDLNELPPET